VIGSALDRIRRHSDPSGALLSVFVTVPPDPAALRELPARLASVMATARMPEVDHATRRRARAALLRVREAGTVRGRDWFGHSMAIVASADAGVLEEMRLPCTVPDRAVFGRRAYVRLPLRSFQQCRPYAVVVVDRRRAWLFDIAGRTVHPVRRLDDEGLRDRSHAGWHGLDEYGVRRHAAELARRHYQATAAALAQLGVNGRAVVVGGHGDGVAEFLASLPPPLRDTVVGTFAIDPHTMTPGEVPGTRRSCHGRPGGRASTAARRRPGRVGSSGPGRQRRPGLRRPREPVPRGSPGRARRRTGARPGLRPLWRHLDERDRMPCVRGVCSSGSRHHRRDGRTDARRRRRCRSRRRRVRRPERRGQAART
jgi:Bacterial archaeo-eukaryotic release factor family 10